MLPIVKAVTVFVAVILGANGQSEPLVATSLGKMKGSQLKSSSGRSFLAFRGIPYAQPPTGSLRFKDPVAVEPWDGVMDATREGPTCLQFDFFGEGEITGTEDCLALNVYTHSLNPSGGSRDVMVWIHGGGFALGSGNGESDLYAPDYLMNKDIVLVTINYRLGVLGFLSTGSKEAPGNYGLMDQNLALKWVRDHIHHFGGNAESVTIFGESAGAASVHFHVLSPLSKGLFHRAISQSGTSLCPWANSDSLIKQSVHLVSQQGCQSADDPIECLRSKEASDLVFKMEKGEMPWFVFGPRVDSERPNPFLPAHPTELLRSGNYNHVPLIMGLTKNEGIEFIGSDGLLSSEEKLQKFQEDPCRSIGKVLTIPEHPDIEGICERAMDFYFDKDRPLAEQISQFERMVSDFTFFKCTDDVVRLQAAHDSEPIFYYLLSHRNQYSITSIFDASGVDYGVAHADDLILMFPVGIVPPLSTAEDLQVSKMMIELWTSFASQGRPTSELFDDWKPTTKDATRYLNISTKPQLVTEEMPFHHRLAVWDEIISPSTVKDEL